MSGELMSRAARALVEAQRLRTILAGYPQGPGCTHPCRDAHVELERVRSAAADRAVIEQAKGMLMFRARCDAEEAFQLLREVSQAKNVKVRDVAAALVAERGV